MVFWTEGKLRVKGLATLPKGPDLPDQRTINDLVPRIGAPSPEQDDCLLEYYKLIKKRMDERETVDSLKPVCRDMYRAIVEGRYAEAKAAGDEYLLDAYRGRLEYYY
ncbi:hypothetical protein AX16_006180 [Volvariella volvacea WC 439]|nr:hypothetical protein AX16_006180 [Volvariella volvacea WC 439]